MKSSFITAFSLVGVIGAGSAAALVNTSIFDSTPDAVEAAFVPGAAVVELTLPEVADPAAGSANASGMSLEQLTGGAAEQTPATDGNSSVDQAASSPSAESPSAVSSSGTLSAKEAVTNTVAPTPTTTEPTPTTTEPTPTTTEPTPEQPSLLTRYDLGGAGSVTVDVADGRVTLIDATAAAGWTVIKSEVDAVANQVEVELSDGSMVVDFEVGYFAGELIPEIRTESVSNEYHDEDDDEHDDDDDDDEHDDEADDEDDD